MSTSVIQSTIPGAKEIATLAHEYLGQEGISMRELASRVGYSRETLNQLFNGNYSSGSRTEGHLKLRSELFTFFQQERAALAGHADSGTLYETGNVQLIRQYFSLALDRRRSLYFRGAPGCQKTYVLRRLVRDFNAAEAAKNGHGRRAYYVRCDDNLSRRVLLRRIAKAIGAYSSGTAEHLLDNIKFHLRRRVSLLVFDEAQGLDFTCLEAIRHLVDELSIGVVFAGSHQLEQIFEHPSLRQWHSRIFRCETLPGLSEDEARQIICGELGAVADPKVKKLVEGSYDTDLYRGKKVDYISARRLFWAIEEIQQRQAQKVQATA
jgi:DNA transposition AAA+ family ATPase